MFNLFISQDLKRVFKITGNNYVISIQKKVLKQVQEFVVEFDIWKIFTTIIFMDWDEVSRFSLNCPFLKFTSVFIPSLKQIHITIQVVFRTLEQLKHTHKNWTTLWFLLYWVWLPEKCLHSGCREYPAPHHLRITIYLFIFMAADLAALRVPQKLLPFLLSLSLQHPEYACLVAITSQTQPSLKTQIELSNSLGRRCFGKNSWIRGFRALIPRSKSPNTIMPNVQITYITRCLYLEVLWEVEGCHAL